MTATDPAYFTAFGIVPGDGIHIVREEALGLNRARHLALTHGSFTAEQAERASAAVSPRERNSAWPSKDSPPPTSRTGERGKGRV
ncbi:hypothetical protein ABZ484_20810 [Streptomyces sp. NPDC006393]|uniref:hypothetical protein n=1 Tax=Streptomyces sp. NPDC006393 TaxID=3156763 RepID=UPI003409009E